MMSRETIHRLLYAALIEIRMEAYALQQQHIFLLADLFHNIPLQLERVSQGEGSYEDILAWLQKRAGEKGCKEWLDTTIEAEKQQSSSSD